jgi:hypothetical protein
MPFPPSVSGKTGGYDGLVPSVTVAVFVFPSRRYVSFTVSPGLFASIAALRLRCVRHCRPVDRGDHVAGLKAGLLRGCAASHLGELDPV